MPLQKLNSTVAILLPLTLASFLFSSFFVFIFFFFRFSLGDIRTLNGTQCVRQTHLLKLRLADVISAKKHVHVVYVYDRSTSNVCSE